MPTQCPQCSGEMEFVSKKLRKKKTSSGHYSVTKWKCPHCGVSDTVVACDRNVQSMPITRRGIHGEKITMGDKGDTPEEYW